MSTTRQAAGPTRKPTEQETRIRRQRIEDLFGFPGLVNLAAVLNQERATMSPRGRRSPYSDACLLAVTATARITGSLAETHRLLSSDEDLWRRCRESFERVHGEALPITAPDKDRVDYLRKKLTTPSSELLVSLTRAFSAASVGQAQAMGNLLPGRQPQWADPDPRHAIFGDGTIVKPYSDVTVMTNPITGEVVYNGSRARTGAAKIQQVNRFHGELGADGKPERGINFVSMHTRTDAGRVVLAVDWELGAEAWTALDLIDQVIALSGDGVHSVVYDRALTGWHGAYLMGRHRVQLYGKAVARRRDDDSQAVEWNVSERLRRATLGMELDYLARAVAKTTVLDEMYNNGLPQPVGTNLYERGNSLNRKYDLVHGVYFFLTATHDDAHGKRCEHDLVMDDGALYTVEYDDLSEQLVKTRHLSCSSSTPQRTRAGAWRRVSTYPVPCGDGDFTFEVTWDPEPTRYRRDSAESNRSPKDPIASRLHPVTRRDEKFSFVSRARNDVEGYNSWFKGTLPGQSRTRGSSITLEGQMLDFLLAAVVENSITWAAHTRRG